MISKERLLFLTETFKKYNLKTVVLDKKGLFCELERIGAPAFLVGKKDVDLSFTIAHKTLYTFYDGAGFNYRYLKLKPNSFLLIGPFLTQSLTDANILELGEKFKVSPNRHGHFSEYLSTIPVIPTHSRLLAPLDTFLELEWNTQSFSIIDLNDAFDTSLTVAPDTLSSKDFDDVIISMQAMEKRYEFENELIKAVSLGQIHKQSQFFTGVLDNAFEERADNPLRNAKNYDIIMNTLLRKAAENGGVHPLYIDRTSSAFAHKIEKLNNVHENPALMKEMFVSYCRLVNKHSGRNYSPIVQKAIIHIDCDLSADLTGGAIAKKLNVSLGYLSTVFKKETQKTVSEYVREKRIKYAKKLLATTCLQIQTIALHCGILDLQYFTKIFKKEVGKTPKQFRLEAKALNQKA